MTFCVAGNFDAPSRYYIGSVRSAELILPGKYSSYRHLISYANSPEFAPATKPIPNIFFTGLLLPVATFRNFLVGNQKALWDI